MPSSGVLSNVTGPAPAAQTKRQATIRHRERPNVSSFMASIFRQQTTERFNAFSSGSVFLHLEKQAIVIRKNLNPLSQIRQDRRRRPAHIGNAASTVGQLHALRVTPYFIQELRRTERFSQEN